MSTSVLALGIAGGMVVGLVVSLGALSLLIGAIERYFGAPKLTLLKTKKGETGFAFAFEWNESKEPATYNEVKLRLFNPYGDPKQIDLAQSFEATDESFAKDVSFGPGYKRFLEAKGFERAKVEIQLDSKDGVSFLKEMKASEFLAKIKSATKTVEDFVKDTQQTEEAPAGSSEMGVLDPKKFGIVNRGSIADTVPGKGPVVAVPSNPAFAQFFGSPGKGGAEEKKEDVPNFAVSKVWIEPGCIVCNACEDIYPEVFEVLADTCIVRDNYPKDNGLLVQEAAEACPVEVIKFQSA